MNEKLKDLVKKIYDEMAAGQVPKVELKSRNKENIVFDNLSGVWKYGNNIVSRYASKASSAKSILKMLYIMDFIDEMDAGGKTSTLREMYYISEGWNLGKFESQDESDLMTEDLEVITSLLREEMRLRPEESGASVIGNITLKEMNRKGEWKRLNCRDDVGDAGYTIPYNVEPEKIQFESHDVDFVLAIETGGMFDRLVENRFDEKMRSLLVHVKGQPSRSTKRLINRLNKELNVPIVVFTDGDPWSFRIFASIAYGAIKTAHISDILATPSSEFVGITATDITRYDLPTDKLSDKDVEALNAELEDPRFNIPFWKGEITEMLRLGRKAEQQALAKYGLDFVTDKYLPEKLREIGTI
ncbi:MAG: DNA topoisomerase IV subunit A [Candidatus Thermoplasmatota archaeon]|jgi:DNA topoisomerase-6 subunit A|nr:DNA topoisomerase IV subunit A [Candidatus Thermoplasmatota archaeon]